MTLRQELELADKYGAKPEDDPVRGEGWCSFDLNGWSTWYCHRGWACAQLIDGKFRNHRYFDTLEEALQFMKNAEQ